MATIFIPIPPSLQPSQSGGILRTKYLRGALMLLALVALTICLGIWQLWRANDKHRLLQEIDQIQSMPELRWEQGVPPQWRKLSLQGQWLKQYEIWLDHRVQQGKVGYHIITPFQLRDGTILLVNRGWWAQGKGQPPSASGESHVLVQSWPRYVELGAAPVTGRIFQNIDPGRFAAWAYLSMPAGYVLALDPAPGMTALAQERPFGVERHLAYSLSWFLMAAFGGFLFYRHYMKAEV
ncbi:SURF1 family protein [Chitinibacter sp. S2-10]|uniref:SURF1 family protein n=1 Tax=Chitinibacter sp. S2-10 TaxID=3373597 RepID=UPI0039777943